MKTNVDFNFNSPQEDIYKSKEKKEKENEHKNENISKINNSNRIIEENDEKNIENKNIKEEKNEEDPLITHITSSRKISDEEIKTSSILMIEEIDGTLLNGKKIEINAGGMVEGRNKKDGFTIFGQKKKRSSKNIIIEENNINNDENDIFVPDYEINYSYYLGYPYIFTIYYKKEDKSYYLRAYCGKGSDNKILFIKLNNTNKYILRQKELISAGNIIFQVTPLDNGCIEIINLTNKKYSNYRRVFDKRTGRRD